jgi:hypothetical protein
MINLTPEFPIISPPVLYDREWRSIGGGMGPKIIFHRDEVGWGPDAPAPSLSTVSSYITSFAAATPAGSTPIPPVDVKTVAASLPKYVDIILARALTTSFPLSCYWAMLGTVMSGKVRGSKHYWWKVHIQVAMENYKDLYIR